ncbi:MAG TPA: hypothetical protein ENH82_12170 [bacterium]|nr:hypothetical protein [bacterium]
MKATELRIGNYVYYHGTNGPTHNIYKIDGIDISLMESKKGYLKLHTPIQLTEQWVKDFEYVIEFQDEDSNNVFKLGNLKVVIKKEVIYFGIWNVPFEKFKKKIKYVHQLQNLYFVLTEKELTKQ